MGGRNDPRGLVKILFNEPAQVSMIPVILSQTVMTKTIEALGLQALVQTVGFFDKKWKAMRSKTTLLEDERFDFVQLHYEGEKKQQYYLRFLNANKFELLNLKKSVIVSGYLGEKLKFNGITLTLIKTPSSLKIGKFYPLTIFPRVAVVKECRKKISIKPLQEEKKILLIKFADTSRYQAAAFINTLMEKYEEFLIEENQDATEAHLSYLDKRREELNQKLDIEMQNHAALFKKNLGKQGFMGMQEELKYVLQPLQLHKARLDEIDMEMSSLDKRPSPAFTESAKLSTQFDRHLAQEIKKASAEKFISQKGLSDLFFRRKNLQENSTYIDALETDFRGMSLAAIQTLFQQYCHQLDQLHSQMKQLIFFRDNLLEPHFEMTTLSTILSDTVTEQLVKKSSEIESQLCDSINHSEKEHQRLKEALSSHKRFLQSHLNQTLNLGKIRIQLIKEKISSLHGVMRDLLKKEKEVLEKKIFDIKKSLEEIPELWRLEKGIHFKGELIKGMMEGLTEIAESKNLSRHLYQVESKPLDKALKPIAPLPRYPFLKSLGGGLIAMILLYVAYLIHYFFKGFPLSLATLQYMGATISGTFSTRAELPFEKLSHHDLFILRSMTSFLLSKNKRGVVSLLGEQGSNFCFNLANLLTLHQKKICIIDCDFDRVLFPESVPGLWHYLNGQIENVPFRQKEKYDFIPAGGRSHFGVELLSSHQFSELLKWCRDHYHFTFLIRQAPLSSQEALQSFQQSDFAVITLAETSQTVLEPFYSAGKKGSRPVIFSQYPIRE